MLVHHKSPSSLAGQLNAKLPGLDSHFQAKVLLGGQRGRGAYYDPPRDSGSALYPVLPHQRQVQVDSVEHYRHFSWFTPEIASLSSFWSSFKQQLASTTSSEPREMSQQEQDVFGSS